eukprot:1410051-Rhodomonas_salina.2
MRVSAELVHNIPYVTYTYNFAPFTTFSRDVFGGGQSIPGGYWMLNGQLYGGVVPYKVVEDFDKFISLRRARHERARLEREANRIRFAPDPINVDLGKEYWVPRRVPLLGTSDFS